MSQTNVTPLSQDVADATISPLSIQASRQEIAQRLAEIGYQLDGEMLNRACEFFGEIAFTSGRWVDNDTLHMLMKEMWSDSKDSHQKLTLGTYTSSTNESGTTIAHVKLRYDGATLESDGVAADPIEAVAKAMENALEGQGLWPGEIVPTDFDFRSTKGIGFFDAQWHVLGRVCLRGTCVHGRAKHNDIVHAFALAFADVLDQLIEKTGDRK